MNALTNLPAGIEHLWAGLTRAEATINWSAAYTPLFPSAWPPAAGQAWIGYGYAYGQTPQLTDGLRVARPWVRIEKRAGAAWVGLQPLTGQLEAFATQGVRPLRPEELAVLQTAEAVERAALDLAGAPPAAKARQLRAYYRQWQTLHGAIERALPAAPAGFLAWLRAD